MREMMVDGPLLKKWCGKGERGREGGREGERKRKT